MRPDISVRIGTDVGKCDTCHYPGNNVVLRICVRDSTIKLCSSCWNFLKEQISEQEGWSWA